MATKEAPGVTLANSSLAPKLGLPPGNFFNEVGSTIREWLGKGIAGLKQLAKDMWNGAGELGKALLRGDWKLFEKWLKNDPVAVIAGVGAVALLGGVVVGGVVAGVGALTAALGLGGSLTLMGIGGTLLGFATAGAVTIYNFDFNKTDKQIYDEINNAFTSLAGRAGEALGASLAGFILNKDAAPTLRIDIRATATMFLVLEDTGQPNKIAEEILEELASLGWAFYNFAKTALFGLGYVNFRKWAKANIKSGIPWVDKMIAAWGQGDKPWIIANKVDEVIETVRADNKAVGNFLAGVTEGFGERFIELLNDEANTLVRLAYR